MKLEKEEALVEKIKQALIELIHLSNNNNSIIRNSDYLVEKTGMNYQYLSSLFKQKEKITLEKYIILLKIEKAKELITYNELSLSEISYMMGYSSVQYLSSQFKNITGLTVSQFKQSPNKSRKPLNKIIPG